VSKYRHQMGLQCERHDVRAGTTARLPWHSDRTGLATERGRLGLRPNGHAAETKVHRSPMKLLRLASILAVLSPFGANAQLESSDSNRGAAFPSPGSQRGANFPKGVSPTERNSTNWVTSPQEYTQPDTWLRWQGRYPRDRWRYERW
jgi:hypothetical protein